MTTNLSNLFMLSENISRSISAENPHGEKGKGAMEIPADEANPAFDLGRGWKVRPCIQISSGETYEIAHIEGPAMIKSMWMTCFPEASRWLLLRIYWDGGGSSLGRGSVRRFLLQRLEYADLCGVSAYQCKSSGGI